MATTIRKFGRDIATPSTFITANVQGLDPSGTSPLGPIAIIGECVGGGLPVTDMTDPDELLRLTNPSAAKRAIKSGDLLDACLMAFNPSLDPQVPSGAGDILAVKVNTAIQAETALLNSKGPIIDLTTVLASASANQTSISVSTPAATNRTVELTFEGTTELGATLGGTGAATLIYEEAGGVNCWDSVKLTVSDTGKFVAAAQRTELCQRNGTDFPNAISSGVTVTVTAGLLDATKALRVFGLGVGGVAQAEDFTLINGAVVGVKLWTDIYGAVFTTSAVVVADANVTISDTSDADIVLLMATADHAIGVYECDAMFVAMQKVAVRSTVAGTVLVFGKAANGSQVVERLTPAAADITTLGTTDFFRIDYLILGGIVDTATCILSAHAIETDPSAQATVQQLNDYIDLRRAGTQGFFFVSLDGDMTVGVDVFDAVNAVEIMNASLTLTNVVYRTLEWFAGSAIATAEQSAFVMDSTVITLTAVNTFNYFVTINGFRASYLSDGSATLAEVQAGLVAACNTHPGVKAYVEASAQSTNEVLLTARQSAGFLSPTLAGSNMTQVYTAGTGLRTGPSSPVSDQVFAGGSEGTATQPDWQAALDMLTKLPVRTIVCLSGDPSVHAALLAHLDYMAGLGKSERDAIIGLTTLDGNDEPTGVLATKTSIKNQIIALSNRNLRFVAQKIKRLDPTGKLIVYQPWFFAAIIAGMQAGAPLGLPLTRKLINIRQFGQDSSWNPIDDSDEMIQAGLLFCENVRGLGIRIVRNITGIRGTNNLALTEGSMNDVVNFLLRDWREALDIFPGQIGGSDQDIISRSASRFNRYIDQKIVTSWTALQVITDFDTKKPAIQVTLPAPINFIDATMFLQI